MERYGIVDLIGKNRAVRPMAKASDFKVEFGLNVSFGPQAGTGIRDSQLDEAQLPLTATVGLPLIQYCQHPSSKTQP